VSAFGRSAARDRKQHNALIITIDPILGSTSTDWNRNECPGCISRSENIFISQRLTPSRPPNSRTVARLVKVLEGALTVFGLGEATRIYLAALTNPYNSSKPLRIIGRSRLEVILSGGRRIAVGHQFDSPTLGLLCASELLQSFRMSIKAPYPLGRPPPVDDSDPASFIHPNTSANFFAFVNWRLRKSCARAPKSRTTGSSKLSAARGAQRNSHLFFGSWLSLGHTGIQFRLDSARKDKQEKADEHVDGV
jgi:hypothetical protein